MINIIKTQGKLSKVVNSKKCRHYPKICKKRAYETKYRSFDFALTDEDVKKDTKKSTIHNPKDLETARWIVPYKMEEK
ncbi:hypothetical protein [Campylobacter concisus]|uniref:hypothetical protein n=1 Tax=Campylobacter concisus TaxID=199 RepID=UPI001CA57D58|nr:hypothetical protein [Campylobacter concisus]